MAKKSTGGRLPARVWATFMKSLYGEAGKPEGELIIENEDASEEREENIEDFDEISDHGAIAPAAPPNVETEDEFEQLVNQVAG